MLTRRHFSRAVAALCAAVLVLVQARSTQAQPCSASVDLSAPASVAPFSTFIVNVTAINSNWTLEVSTNGGTTWSGITGGILSRQVSLSSTGCQTTALYRLVGTFSQCAGGGSFVRGPIAVNWDTYVPQIALQVQSAGTHERYDVTASLLNPAPLSPSVLVSFEISENGGQNWNGLFGRSIGAAPVVIGSLQTTGCATTRLHRLVYAACSEQFPSPIATLSWSDYVPDLSLSVEQVDALSPYAVTARLNNPRPLLPAIVVSVEASENGGQTWGGLFVRNVGATPTDVGTLQTTGCATTRLHRLAYNACSQQFVSPTATLAWPDYVPQVELTLPQFIQPLSVYPLTARLLNPPELAQSVFVAVEISDNGGQSFTSLSTVIATSVATAVSNLPSTGCITTRIHRVRYTSCATSRIVGSVTGSWPSREGAGDIIAPRVITPGINYQVRVSVTGTPNNFAAFSYSDDGGATYIGSVGFTGSSTFTVSGNGCSGTRIHRISWTDYCGLPAEILDISCCSDSAVLAVAQQPNDVIVACAFVPATFVIEASSSAPVLYQWQYRGGPTTVADWTDVIDGPNVNASAFLFIAFGSSAASLTVDRSTLPQGTLGERGWMPSGDSPLEFRCRVESPCAEAASAPALLIVPDHCTGDVSGNSAVGLEDVAAVIEHWEQSSPPVDPCLDLDRSGTIGLGDLAIIISAWGEVCGDFEE